MYFDNETPALFNPAKDTAAVFIDFENMRLTVEKTGGEPFQMNKILEYVSQNIGMVAIKKAYSNWHFVNPLMFDLLGNNIDMIQVYTRGAQRKNAADIRLTADAMETLFTFPHITTFVIVASDSDYTGLILKLREHSKKVVGIGTRENTNEYLVRACNLFRFYRTIAADDPESLREAVGELDFQEAKELLVRAMQRHRFTDRPAVGRWLRWQMIQLEPSFDERDFGFATYRDFLKACSDVVRFTEEGPYRELKVVLIPSTPEASQDAGGGAVQAPEDEAGNADRPQDQPHVVDPASLSYTPLSAHEADFHQSLPAYPRRKEEIKRSDYLRTLWLPRIYLYNRSISAPLIREILRVNAPGKPLSEYELEEYLLGPYAERLEMSDDIPHYELTQKTVYAIQKLLFWAGIIRFLDDDETTYWKRRQREIPPEFADEKALFEQVDFSLAKHFASYLPLVAEVMTSILQGDDSIEYAEEITARVTSNGPQDDDSLPLP